MTTSANASGGGRHALLIAWGFPPAKSGGVFRMAETANVLIEEGWRVSVIACDIEDLRRFAGTDEVTLEMVDPRVRVHRVPFDLGPRETDLHRWDELRAAQPNVWRKAYNRSLADLFPAGLYAPWLKPALQVALDIHDADPLDIAIASGGPFVSFGIAGQLRAERAVPYVLDYRDAWSLHQFEDRTLHGPGSVIHGVETELLAGALEAWFVNEPMRAWHERSYPVCAGHTRVVTNGFDASALTGLSAPEPPPAGRIRFGYLGTLTAAVPLAACLRGYLHARQSSALVAESSLDFYGYLGFYPTPDEALLRQLKEAAEEGVSWLGPVPKSAVGETYSRLDALVLSFGGTRYVTSGKVFEYMATGRPIVSVHAPENAVRDVLEGYPLWFQAASYGPEDVAAAFAGAADAVMNGAARDPQVLDVARAHALSFDRRECLRVAAQALEPLLEDWERRSRPTGRRPLVLWLGSRPAPDVREFLTAEHVRLRSPLTPGPFDSLRSEGVRGAQLLDRLAHMRARWGPAEPGTSVGRARLLAAQPERLPAWGADEQVPDAAVGWLRLAGSALPAWADLYLATGLDGVVAATWVAASIPGSVTVLDLRGIHPGDGEADRAALAAVRLLAPKAGLVLADDEDLLRLGLGALSPGQRAGADLRGLADALLRADAAPVRLR